MEPVTETTLCDLEKFRKTAKTRRELAWELLKETRNPDYVGMRYGYPLEIMRAALAKIPEQDEPKFRRSALRQDSNFKNPADEVPDVIARE